MVNTYSQRNLTLQQMGFANYAEYLASDLWKSIRAKAFRKKRNLCKLCSGPGQVLHHLSYSRTVLEGRHNSKLVIMCHKCHKEIEFDENGDKRTVQQVNVAFGLSMRNRNRQLLTYDERNKIKSDQLRGAKRKAAKVSQKPRCACGNFRKHNRKKCKVCEIESRIVQ